MILQLVISCIEIIVNIFFLSDSTVSFIVFSHYYTMISTAIKQVATHRLWDFPYPCFIINMVDKIRGT
jgi:hypothetical protein